MVVRMRRRVFLYVVYVKMFLCCIYENEVAKCVCILVVLHRIHRFTVDIVAFHCLNFVVN